MKVFQINSDCGMGSTGRIAADISKLLTSAGDECCIAYGRDGITNGLQTIRVGSKLDVYLHALYTRITDKSGFASTYATKRLIKKIEKYNPDLIQLHNLHGYYLNIELLFEFLSKYNRPVVWTLHDCWAFTGHCAYFDYVKCEKWKSGCYDCVQKKSYPASKLLDNSEWNYTHKKALFNSLNNMTLVTPSNWLAKLVKESYLGRFPVKVINNGINIDVFHPTTSDFRKKYFIEDKTIILGVANIWDHRKGIEFFYELERRLSSKYCIILVGVTEKQKEELTKSMIGITRTNNLTQLAEIYTAADIFVNPTLEDNFPTTNIEALACGTVVITFDTGGSAEAINNSCGIVIQKNDVEALIEAIETIDNSSISKENCRNRAMMFDKNNKYLEYINLYRERTKGEEL